ncbi:hypothetical protein BJ973_005174 [Actinoplanes tereljensis]|uniref:DUF1905 domain-containing protein n=1 Tax=Paractinoplanes tereljensis TaxID=571912 RepID=A0A919TSH5_9ACTN|nr:DUF1905 domain-containing protein [Actinoplanes tereljensis]GIF21378.1 hypothetical protein Ate02nite_41080 [Actinoplanes tereljensis]
MHLEFDAELWIWAARPDEGWTFVSLPVDASDEIRDLTGDQRRGFGAVRVEARIGTSIWRTSVFPDAKEGAYVLPIKKAVRKAQKIEAGDTTRVAVEILI